MIWFLVGISVSLSLFWFSPKRMFDWLVISERFWRTCRSIYKQRFLSVHLMTASSSVCIHVASIDRHNKSQRKCLYNNSQPILFVVFDLICVWSGLANESFHLKTLRGDWVSLLTALISRKWASDQPSFLSSQLARLAWSDWASHWPPSHPTGKAEHPLMCCCYHCSNISTSSMVNQGFRVLPKLGDHDTTGAFLIQQHLVKVAINLLITTEDDYF